MGKHKKSPKIKYFIFTIVILTLFSVVYTIQYFNFTYDNQFDNEFIITPASDSLVIRRQPYHTHVDFKVVLSGEEINFNHKKYDEVNPYAHLHLRNPNGDKVIHFEGTANATLGLFFESLKITFNSTCFILDTGENFCNSNDNTLRVFVNGKEDFGFDLYWPQDSDRILIIYGSYTKEELETYIGNVTDEACIYSRKCPERVPLLPVPEKQLIF